MKKKAVCLTVLAVMIAGCSTGGESPRPADAPTSEASALDPRSVSTPLDAYLPSEEVALSLHQAEVKLVNSCFRRLGYDRNPMPEPVPAHPEDLHPEFLMFTVDQAGKTGYGPSLPPPSAEGSWDKRSTKAQQQILRGEVKLYKGEPVPKGGCVREAADRINRGTKVPSKIVGEGFELKRLEHASPTGLGEAHVKVLRLEAVSRAKADGRVVAVVGKWSKCMSRAGFPYRSLDEAVNDDRWGGDRASPLERATARADMVCKGKVKYLNVASAVQSEYENRVILQRKTELATLRSNIKKWGDNAAQVLGR
ncbi:hypothetical protein [Streptomyces sp. MS2.AVA.5]|uniref:Uncharacterized protein n=1 Tax=Streptomyces achmelvichensis TaxID=3134111 RepID=A0ACC6PZU2_9ACTN